MKNCTIVYSQIFKISIYSPLTFSKFLNLPERIVQNLIIVYVSFYLAYGFILSFRLVYGFIFLFKWTEERKSRRKAAAEETTTVYNEEMENEMFFAQQVSP